jgi:hypothetical protein
VTLFVFFLEGRAGGGTAGDVHDEGDRALNSMSCGLSSSDNNLLSLILVGPSNEVEVCLCTPMGLTKPHYDISGPVAEYPSPHCSLGSKNDWEMGVVSEMKRMRPQPKLGFF